MPMDFPFFWSWKSHGKSMLKKRGSCAVLLLVGGPLRTMYKKVLHWCGLRPSVLGQDRSVSDQNIGLGLGLGLAGLVLCCETRSCDARRHNDLEGDKNFSSTIVSLYFGLGTSLLWRSTVAFTYLNVKSAKCLLLLPVVLVLILLSWSCSWS